jgi:hypothetical protein
MDRDIGVLEGQLNSLKAQIDRMENDARAGIEVDEDQYNSAVDRHNALIPRYRQLVQNRNQYASQYNAALAEDRRLVAEHNSLVR